MRWFRREQRRGNEFIGRRRVKMELPGRRQSVGSKRRFVDVVREDLQIVGVREEDVEDRERLRTMIGCGDD